MTLAPATETPWGRWTVLARGEDFLVKLLELAPGRRFSLQYHNRRIERWTVAQGHGVAQLDGQETILDAGATFSVPRGCLHRLTNVGDFPLQVVEVQYGRDLDEDDIVRVEDDYGRDAP